jgi:hypothetical protein
MNYSKLITHNSTFITYQTLPCELFLLFTFYFYLFTLSLYLNNLFYHGFIVLYYKKINSFI